MGIISLYWIGIIRIMTLLALEYPILKAIMKLKKKEKDILVIMINIENICLQYSTICLINTK